MRLRAAVSDLPKPMAPVGGRPFLEWLLLYLGAALGCAVANYLGNQGWHVLAIPLIAATVLFILYYLRPFKSWPRT